MHRRRLVIRVVREGGATRRADELATGGELVLDSADLQDEIFLSKLSFTYYSQHPKTECRNPN